MHSSRRCVSQTRSLMLMIKRSTCCNRSIGLMDPATKRLMECQSCLHSFWNGALGTPSTWRTFYDGSDAVQFGTYFDDLPEYPKRTLQQYRFAPLGSTNELDGEQIAGEATTKRCVVASPQDQAIPRNENERNDLTENRDSTCSFFQDTDVKHPSTLHEELSRRLLQLSGWQQLILCLMA